jgi:hypothetical protein
VGANVKVEDLGDIVAKGWQLGIRCRCGRKATISAADTLRWYRCHGWDTRIAFVPAHLWCTRCRGRPCRVGISADTPLNLGFFPAYEEDWKALTKRLRG